MSRPFVYVAATLALAFVCALAWVATRDRVSPTPAGSGSSEFKAEHPAVGVDSTPGPRPEVSGGAEIAERAAGEAVPPVPASGQTPTVAEPSPPVAAGPDLRGPRIAELVALIEGGGGYFGEHIGHGGETPENWKAYAELKELGTIEDLVALVSHPSPAVRAYAFEALVERKADVFPLLQAHLDDLAELARMDGCILTQEKVADIMLELAWDTLEPAQREVLTDRILAEELDLAFRTRVLRTLGTPEGRYETVRRLAARGDAQALVALARFRRASDVPLVLEGFRAEPSRYAALAAMGEFPQPEYLPVLRDYQAGLAGADHFSNEWRALYAALAAYESPEVLPLLEKAFDDEPMRTYHLDFLLKALERHRIPLYEPLMLRLLAESKTSPTILDYLLHESTQGIDAQLPALLEHAGAFDLATLARLVHRFNGGPDSPERRAVLRRFLEKADVHRIELAVMVVAPTRDPEAIPILLRIAENDGNPYMYLAAARGLLIYHQGWIDARLRTMLIEREARTDPKEPGHWGIAKLRGLLERSPRSWKSTGQD